MWITEELRAVLSPFPIYFNKIDLTQWVIPKQDTGRGLAGRDYEIMNIPGREGGLVMNESTPVRYIYQDVLIACDSREELRKRLEQLNALLLTEKPVSLQFGDELDRTYYAKYAGASEGYEVEGFYSASLTFICGDPYKYGNEKTDVFENGTVTVNNSGTQPVKPLYEFIVTDTITNLDIFTDEGYMRVGEPAPIDEPVYERQTLVLSDKLTNLLPWSTSPSADNGYVAGTMTATQAGFTATGFGTELSPRKWQGPSVRRALPEAVQNFQMIVTVDLLNVGTKTGMIEVYLKDAFGNTVAKVGIEDILQSVSQNQTKFQLGNVSGRKVQYYRTADYKPAWNNYTGVLRLFRDGNRFRPYFGLVKPDGRHTWVASSYLYTDLAGDYSAPITHIELAIRKWPGSPEAIMRMRDLKIWRLNDAAVGIPSIATVGDVITVDTMNSAIYINGEDRKDLKDFGSTFFSIPKGQKTVLIQPTDKLTGKIIYREPFL